MQSMKLIVLVLVWAISIILAAAISPTWLIEGTVNHLKVEFSSKEAYVMTVQVVQWIRILYFVSLSLLTVQLLWRQSRWQ